MDEIQQFSVEEGLNQAMLMKLSFTHPSVHELCKLIPKQRGFKGNCRIGQLEHKRMLIRFDLYEEYVHVSSRSIGYIHFNGDDYQYRLFPWTLLFNPKEETSRAWVWISLPGLPPDLFAKTSMLCILSVVVKPIEIDKATHDKSRPSTTRVKVKLHLLDNHPKRIRLQYLDTKYGNIIEHFQEFVDDNLPRYCNYCKYQGHDEKMCHLMNGQNNEQQENLIATTVDNDCALPSEVSALAEGMRKVEKL